MRKFEFDPRCATSRHSRWSSGSSSVAAFDYVSPLIARIAAIRRTILRNAEERGWTIDPEQLDDRHIVRRMVLKRCIYGV